MCYAISFCGYDRSSDYHEDVKYVNLLYAEKNSVQKQISVVEEKLKKTNIVLDSKKIKLDEWRKEYENDYFDVFHAVMTKKITWQCIKLKEQVSILENIKYQLTKKSNSLHRQLLNINNYLKNNFEDFSYTTQLPILDLVGGYDSNYKKKYLKYKQKYLHLKQKLSCK
jgi:exonuclease VII large subunit